jgi:hypothetical protein
MEAVHRQTPDQRLDQQLAHGLWREPILGPESVNKALPRTRGQDFFAEMTKNIRIDSLNLETGLIDQAPGTEARRSLGLDRGLKEPPGFRQAGLGSGQHLGQLNRTRSEDDRMASIDNANVGRPALMIDPPVQTCPEPVRMDGPVEDLEGEVGDPRWIRMDSHGLNLFLVRVPDTTPRQVTGTRGGHVD